MPQDAPIEIRILARRLYRGHTLHFIGTSRSASIFLDEEESAEVWATSWNSLFPILVEKLHHSAEIDASTQPPQS